MTNHSMHEILDIQKRAHQSDPYPDLAIRRDRINRLLRMLLDNRGKFCEAVNSDFNGRCADMTSAVDFLPTVNIANYVLKNMKTWARPEKRHASFPFNILGGRAEVRYLPLGVVGNISPWNFPINLTFGPLSAIFAAGNRSMIKPSELSEATSGVMAELIPNYFEESELAVVTGDASVAAEFSGLPFDHLLFTGSTSVAKHVMAAAAKNLVPVTLELGGKSPVIISRTANIKDAARKIIFGKMINAGQICLAPDYVFIPAPMRDEMIAEMKSAAKEMYPQLSGNQDYTHIINDRHFNRLADILADAKEAGGNIIPLFDDEHADAASRMMPPYLVGDMASNSRILMEEIFGPLLAVRNYDNFSDIKNIIESGDRPLALYYFGSDRNEIAALKNNVISGGMVINDVLSHYMQEDLPFGGVGASGMGMYHGVEGFRNFSHTRSVYKQTPIDIGKMIRPPFSKGRRFVENQLK